MEGCVCMRMQIKIALKLLKEEGLVHYEASFCFDAFQFCVLVSRPLPFLFRTALTCHAVGV